MNLPAPPGPVPAQRGPTPVGDLHAEELWAILDTADIGLLVTDAQRRIVHVNATFTRETGYTLEEVRGQTCRFLQGPDTDPEDIRAMRSALDRGEAFSRVVLNYRKDGSLLHFKVRVRPLYQGGELRYFVGVQEDYTEAHAAQLQLQRWAFMDSLTGLDNRRAFDDALCGHIERGETVELLLLDLNDFKRVNDERGHQAGDALLREVADCLRAHVPAPGGSYRLGGDEFAALLPAGMPSPAGPLECALRALDGGRLRAALGSARFPEEATSAPALFRLADARLYRGKPQR